MARSFDLNAGQPFDATLFAFRRNLTSVPTSHPEMHQLGQKSAQNIRSMNIVTSSCCYSSLLILQCWAEFYGKEKWTFTIRSSGNFTAKRDWLKENPNGQLPLKYDWLITTNLLRQRAFLACWRVTARQNSLKRYLQALYDIIIRL